MMCLDLMVVMNDFVGNNDVEEEDGFYLFCLIFGFKGWL